MNRMKGVALFMVAVVLASCRSKDNVGGNGVPSKSSLERPESVSESKVTDEPISSSSEESPGLITLGDPEVQINKDGKTEQKINGIVPKIRVISKGDEYLIGIDNGSWRHEIPSLTPEDVAGVDLSPIRGEAMQKESPKTGIGVKDSKTAYARVLDLNISLIARIVCQGIYTSDDEKGYFVFYGYQGKPLEQFMFAYYVRKSDGLITLYRKAFEADNN